MIIPLKSLVPTADDVLNAELENLGGLLLRHLKSCEGKSPVFQHAGLNRGYFIAIMERRNVGLGPLPSREPEYGARQPAVTQAFVEAWDGLVREGLLFRNHEQPAVWFLISMKGERFLQNQDRQDSEKMKVNEGENAVDALRVVVVILRAGGWKTEECGAILRRRAETAGADGYGVGAAAEEPAWNR